MQKALTEMNLHLHHVLSDLDGLSGMAIINAILQGERDPVVLASLFHVRCSTPKAQMIEALRGDYRSEHIFILRQCHQTHGQLLKQIAELDIEIQNHLQAVSSPLPPALEDFKPGKIPQQPQNPCFWLRWSTPKGRLNALRRLGVRPRACGLAYSGLGAWPIARLWQMNQALSNKRLHQYGFILPWTFAEAAPEKC